MLSHPPGVVQGRLRKPSPGGKWKGTRDGEGYGMEIKAVSHHRQTKTPYLCPIDEFIASREVVN